MTLVWAISTLLLFLVLARAKKVRMLGKYLPFYIYVTFVLVVSLSRMAVGLTFGVDSLQYYYAYYGPTFVMPVLQIWILWDIYRRIVGYTKTSWSNPARFSMIASVMTIPILWAVFTLEKGAGFFHQYHTVTLFLQMTLCLLVGREAVKVRREIDLGQNLKGILAGLAVMIGCQTINFAGFAFVQSPSHVFWFLVQFIYFVALIIFTYTLWDDAAVVAVNPAYHDRLERNNEELHQALRSVLVGRK